ncbi:hypothetical protein BJX64DRAFT_14442 [Aspergillus heterothallicus]
MDANLWFADWKSQSDQKLSNTQITRLVALTSHWGHDPTPDTLSGWVSNPSKFWGFDPCCTEIKWIRECLQVKIPSFKDCDENMESIKKVSARRRVLLFLLHEVVEIEKHRLQTSLQAQPAKFLSIAIKNVVGKAYSGKDVKKFQAKCSELQRYGRKYSGLARKGLILAPLQGTPSKSVSCS